MNPPPDILCIGSVLWDMIGRTPVQMRQGADLPGRITRLPGGVACNVARALLGHGLRPALLSAIGEDAEGVELVSACEGLGMDMRHVYRCPQHPTDRYMAIEGADGLVAAIADAHSLEAAGARILAPLTEGPLGSPDNPHEGCIVLDGNLTTALLAEIAAAPAFRRADLRVAPASPGKAERLLPFLSHPGATLHVNLEEAGLLCQTRFAAAAEAALALCARGARRALVTDGAEAAADARDGTVFSARPPQVRVARITGAGDTFMAAHIAAEHKGAAREAALLQALEAAATYVAGDPAA